MQWCKLHADLPDHPKTLRLNELVDDRALFYVIRLWAWTCKFAENGDLSKFTADQIEQACQWDGQRSHLMQSFVMAGFIDQNDKKIRVHDWFKENTRHLKDIQRKRRARTGRGQGADSKQSGGEKGAPQDKTNTQDMTNKQEGKKRFERFWSICTKKKSPSHAEKAFLKLKPDQQEAAIEAWPNHAALWDKEGREEKFKPYPATWLNDGQWAEEIGNQVKPKALKGHDLCVSVGHSWEKIWSEEDATIWTGKNKCVRAGGCGLIC